MNVSLIKSRLIEALFDDNLFLVDRVDSSLLKSSHKIIPYIRLYAVPSLFSNLGKMSFDSVVAALPLPDCFHSVKTCFHFILRGQR